MSEQMERFAYDNRIVRLFLGATMLWGVVGLLVGVIIAFQMAFPNFFNEYLNFSFLAFGRLRPIHTNAIIFAFVGNAIYAGVYYSVQRLVKARMFNDLLGRVHFWGWQLIIVCAAATLFMGISTGKEYAELEWWIDIMIALVWVIFGVNMIGTLIKRRERHLYVAIWFYIATFVTVAVLHIVNSFELPVSLFKSYSWYAGAQDAMVQWWYGHNAVAFFLTTPFLGLMYYFVPKAANRPVYSYRLSIVHFWALIFIYIWAGPHHLLYSATPDWAQTLGTIFSIMLIAPSWGGMINGLLTLRGAWDKVRENPILKFFVVALTSYGMATFEGPMHSLKTVNWFTHFTDWIPAHVHIGTLGWNGMMIFGMAYWMAPRLNKNSKLFSMKLANTHFWIATLGMILWSVSMYWAGTTQGLMWQLFNEEGKLTHQFLATVTAIVPMYFVRALGGTIYLIGFFLFVYNIIKTLVSSPALDNEEVEAPALSKGYKESHSLTGYLRHRVIERKPLMLTLGAAIAILIGTAIEIIPTFLIQSNVPTIASVQPYTPLELEGRDIYVREGCNSCHSQLVRPIRHETVRYGEYSKPGEFVYDHPFLWGSKRTGPDLAREGVGLLKKSNVWHYEHMYSPQSIESNSIMPAYTWLFDTDLDTDLTKKKISAMRTLGVPYGKDYEDQAIDDLNTQAEEIAADLKANGIDADPNKEIIAMIAYLQRLGTDLNRDVANN
ncbi:MAG: cytochrome-c oxidase, cbb3-type subunit I [Bacteroidia bacterium]